MSTYDYDWAAARLADRGVKPECPRCGTKGPWVGLGPAHDKVVWLPAYDFNGQSTGDIPDLYGWCCLNCGFLALHALAVLLGDTANWPRRGVGL